MSRSLPLGIIRLYLSRLHLGTESDLRTLRRRKTTSPLGLRLYEKGAQRRVELTIELVNELIEIGVRRDTYLFDMTYVSEEFVIHLETYGKEWVSAVKSDARVTYGSERIRVDSLAERINTVPRTIAGETYHI
nr:hypothetical protein [Halegenticoccus tardaugens]